MKDRKIERWKELKRKDRKSLRGKIERWKE
jgi:hypothetical protein